MGTEQYQTFFGDRIVKTMEKAELVREVFDDVAERYDLMNDIMSLGVHRLWRQAMVDWLYPRPNMMLADIAGGTGDIAFRYFNNIRGKTGEGSVTIIDINEKMLNISRNRALDRGILNGINWVCGDAEALPVDDSCYDALTIAFGIRNVTNIEKALSEAYRILKPGGRFLSLEFSRTAVPELEQLYDHYSFAILPLLGEAVTGNRDAYEYLVRSIRRFPDQEEFSTMIQNAGFLRVSYRNLSSGIAALHSGWRI